MCAPPRNGIFAFNKTLFSIFCCLSTLNCTSARAYEHKIEVEALRRELDGVSAAVANATKIIAEEIAISRAGVESL